MDHSHLQAMPGHLVRRVHQVSNALFAVECGGYEITSVQYAALVAIDSQPGVDATRLSSLIAFDRSTIGDVLERLEAKGWVVRHPSAEDRRIKRLDLSPTGRRLVQAVRPAVERVQVRLLERLTAAERSTLLGLLARIADRAEPAEAFAARVQTRARARARALG